MTEQRALKVAIIGAGMSGLCMAVKLQEAGIHSFSIFEKAYLRCPFALLLLRVPAQP
jgi:cation diffusion facilitator CzcD-associated flavoprotein CzcO